MTTLGSILRGIGSVMDIFPARRHNRVGEGISGQEDAHAIGRDWRAVGQDLNAAMGDAAEEVRSTGQPDKTDTRDRE